MSNKINLELENFEGPIDLLYSLIKDKKMDIMEVNLDELASSYLLIIDQLKDVNIDLASEYLVMAATLLQIKARALLSNPTIDAKVEKTKEEILRRLVEHQRFKNIASNLRAKEIRRKDIFIKSKSDISNYKFDIDETQLDGKSDAIKLIMTLRKMFERTHAQKMRSSKIQQFKKTPAERRAELLTVFSENPHAGFKEVFSVPNMNHFVLTLITVLDMVSKGEIEFSQSEQFGEIILKKGVINEL